MRPASDSSGAGAASFNKPHFTDRPWACATLPTSSCTCPSFTRIGVPPRKTCSANTSENASVSSGLSTAFKPMSPLLAVFRESCLFRCCLLKAALPTNTATSAVPTWPAPLEVPPADVWPRSWEEQGFLDQALGARGQGLVIL